MDLRGRGQHGASPLSKIKRVLRPLLFLLCKQSYSMLDHEFVSLKLRSDPLRKKWNACRGRLKRKGFHACWGEEGCELADLQLLIVTCELAVANAADVLVLAACKCIAWQCRHLIVSCELKYEGYFWSFKIKERSK